MKNIFKISILAFGALLFLASCEKAESLPYYESGKESGLTLSANAVTLSAANAAQDVVTFSWTDPQFAIDTSNYKHVVEIAPKGTNFANAAIFTYIGSNSSLGVKGADLNNALIAWGKAYGAAADLEARLKSSYSNNNDMKVSPVAELKVSPYAVPFTLSASSTGTFSPTPQTKDDILTKLSWAAPSYGSSTLSYVLEYAKGGTSFANATAIAIAADSLTRSLKGLELYQMANATGIALNSTGNVDVRIKATINNTGQVSYSSTQTLSIKPVEMTLYMYVPGDYQGWNPGAAPRIASSDGISYEGYVWVPTGNSGEFKIASEGNWDAPNYGGTSTPTGGVLDGAGPNLKWPALGAYYLLKVNMTTKAWTVTKTDWGLIGSATPGGWDNSTPMTYDAVTGKWKATVTFTAGEFKFRANNGWDINLGASGAYLDYGKDNIPIGAGSKTITLDLSNPMKYTYTVQ